MTKEREKPGEAAAWEQPYDFKVEGDLWLEVSPDTVVLRHSFDFEAGIPNSYYAVGETQLPQMLTAAGVTPEQFGLKVAEFFFRHFGNVFQEMMVLHLNDAVHHALHSLKLDEIDLRAQAEIHGKQVAEQTRARFNVPATGVPSPWDRRELGRAVRSAVLFIENGRCRTLDKVAGKLREAHPDKGPPNGEALRKLLARHDLSWRELKRGRFIG